MLELGMDYGIGSMHVQEMTPEVEQLQEMWMDTQGIEVLQNVVNEIVLPSAA